MSRDAREENVGQIVVRSDESFWILPRRHVVKKDIDLYSPWFSCFGEKWRFIMSPKYSDFENTDFYLWRKFCRDLPARQYILELKLKTKYRELIAFSVRDSNCDYGFEEKNFVNRDVLLNPRITDCGQIKIFFVIKEKIQSVDNLLPFEGEQNQNDESKENETSSEDEMISDEDDDENKRVISADKGVDRLVQNLKSLMLDEQSSDVVLKVEDREFKAHKNILKVRSPVFAAMFQPHTKENTTGVVDIPDCTASAFEVFLLYVYTGCSDVISSGNVCDLYYAADKYEMNDLKAECVEFMENNLSVENFCEIMALCSRHSESRLHKTATLFFCENIKLIIKTVQWQKFLKDFPIQANELFIKSIKA